MNRRNILRANLSEQSKELLNSTFQLRKILSQVLAPDLVNHIIELIVKDEAHEKFLELTKDD